MKIDRHNYEECFLLYVDNELTVEQKKQVELFVKENPDLEEELLMLRQSRLIPDNTIVFADKQSLMKEENGSLINLHNYEEWLLLYVDDELNEEEKLEIEKFAAAHPRVQQELALFRQAKLPDEKLVFASKQTLYRQEQVRIISVQWWKVAVAAMLVLVAGITLYFLFSRKNFDGSSNENIAKTTEKIPSVDSQKNSGVGTRRIISAPSDRQQPQGVITASTYKEPKKAKKQPEQLLSSKQENGQQLASNADNNNLPQHATSQINDPKMIRSQISDAVVVGDRLLNENFNMRTVTSEPSQTPEPMYASNTDKSENKRLRGFFRKATRLIAHTTNINPADDDNRVLIGGMAINLK